MVLWKAQVSKQGCVRIGIAVNGLGKRDCGHQSVLSCAGVAQRGGIFVVWYGMIAKGTASRSTHPAMMPRGANLQERAGVTDQ